eukprot:1158235-Pelagomonas_calceolata.AAC.1
MSAHTTLCALALRCNSGRLGGRRARALTATSITIQIPCPHKLAEAHPCIPRSAPVSCGQGSPAASSAHSPFSNYLQPPTHSPYVFQHQKHLSASCHTKAHLQATPPLLLPAVRPAHMAASHCCTPQQRRAAGASARQPARRARSG